ncbi:uncharacterized protein LOC106167140 [Lingula anatina]|uniref:Uncharacterized protein LOC106167140 n=1 Tax=Lingula anatina TaxID=7574 RepID=A0A1S3ISW2_LINAN|nr:uncharacterized protein LOC106167140 [Lingula anatina]|eukprot:XP_013401300.1 uncharacterized protein LOC106167140 [Lingula anatina]
MAIGIQKPKTFGDPVEMVQTPPAESLTDVKGGIFNGMVTKRASSTGDSRSYTSPDRAAAANPDDGGSHASPVRTVERDYIKNIDPDLLDKIEKLARGQPVEPEKQVTIWDFGGQDVYYTTHQTFLSEHIIYLLVFRLDVDLDRKIPVYRGQKTVKEFIMFWLNSIHMHTVERLREEDRDVIPYVLIIGTHKDRLGSQVDVKDIFGKLSKCLDDKQVLKDHVYQYFAINNLAEDDAEFDKIKRVIEKLCGYSSDSKATVQKFSVGWIQLEMDLAKKSEEIPIITVEELCKMAQRVGLSDGELQDSFIPYHHQQGDILHFKVDGLENIVIIDPLWLADVFSAIMTPTSSHPGCSYGDILKDELKRGVLKEEVFDEYLKEIKMTENKTEIIQLMLHFDLMLEISQSVENPIPGSGKRRFVVPSMLVSNNNANNALSESDPQKYLLIAFPHIPFPTGLFHRLIIRLLRKYKAQRYENNIPVVGFDRASFRLEDKQSVLHLVVEDKVIKLLITNATGNPPKPHMYANTRKTVEDELSTLRNTYCPRMHFVYCIRIKDDGPNIQIQAQDVQTREVICACLETSEVSIDLRPYRVWFSHEEKEQRRPQSMEEDDLFRDKAFDDKQVYRNYTEWRGKAVIINNISFDNRYYPDRDGTEVDVERLEILFKQLHYLVSKHDNLSAGSINQLAEREARSDHSAYSSFIMVVLSHGSENTVIGTDGYHIGYDQIMAHFEASRCPTLSGKPKMFFISACQSSPVENAAVLDTKPKQATAKQQETPQTPEKADMILVLATTRGDRSWRTPANGTWFIQNLVTELSERARETHLLDILTQVNQSVSQMTTQEGCRQVSTIAMCTLRKHVYFWPGYYCENGEIKQYPQ